MMSLIEENAMSAQAASTTQAQHLDIGPHVAEPDSRFSRIYRGMLASAGFAAFVLVSAPALALVAPPDLLTSSTYAIVSTTTTVTGSTTAHGNVCYTGLGGVALTLDPGVTPVIPCAGHTTDQDNVKIYLDGQGGCTALTAATALEADTVGNGLATPGTYNPGCYTAAGTMDIAGAGTVTLDGAGVYLFRGVGALTANAGSKIVLLNGATANNVFWTTSAATLLNGAGAGIQFVGTVIVPANDITLAASTTLNGRAWAGHNSVLTGNAAIITSPILPSLPTAIPTLSQWAMITFALLIVGFGLYMQRRRRV